MSDKTTTHYVAVGSNLPHAGSNPLAVVQAAVGHLRALGAVVCSPLYATPAFPPGSGPDFVNGVVTVDAALSPRDMLAALHGIEADAGRLRDLRWGARVLDLDLLASDDAVLPNAQVQDAWRALPLKRQTQETPDQLILPHPRLQDRAFVLVPWADIAPGWTHPRTGATVAQMRAACAAADLAAVRPLKSA